MNTLQNIKAKECCCGCTLRTGSLILFWIFLVFEAIATLLYLSELLYGNKRRIYYYANYSQKEEDHVALTFLNLRSFYYFFTTIVGLALCISGIYGIQKNAPKYLTFGLYYLVYNVLFCIVSAVVLIASPYWHAKIIMNGVKLNVYSNGGSEALFVTEVAHFFVIATLLYFVVIVRSYRDSMVKNNGRAGEIPDPSALGYTYA